MTFLPIVGRELLVASRRRSTYRTRLVAAAIGAAIVAAMLILSVPAGPARIGPNLFRALVFLSFCHCVLVGARTTADCLSEERRAGTLGLLFLTELKGYDVVLGKLVVSSLSAFYGLLAIFPLIGVSLTLGGVTAGEFWRALLILMGTMLFALCAGLMISAVSYDERRAVAGTFGLIFLFLAGLPLVHLVFSLPFINAPGSWLLWASPVAGLIFAFEEAYQADATRYWGAMAALPLVSIFLLGLASWFLPRTWRREPGAARARRLGSARGWGGARNWAERARRLSASPVYWLAAEDHRPLGIFWVGLGLLTVIICAVLAAVSGGAAAALLGINVAASFVYLLILRLLVAGQACRFAAEARRTGALELLLATPLSAEEIVRGVQIAIRHRFTVPVAAILVAQLFCGLIAIFTVGFQDRWFGMIFFGMLAPVAGLVSFLTDAWALTWIGVWIGLTSRNAAQATFKTLMRVLILPALLFILVPVFWVFVFLPVGWTGLWVVKNVILVEWARKRFRSQFRTVAAQAYSPESSSWSSRWLGEKRSPPILRTQN